MRVTPVGNGAPQATQTYWDALKQLRPDNVWLNYMLVDAQWGQTPTPLGTPNAPAFLANTTLETYVQAPQKPDGCINCHGSYAAKGDLDFQVLDAYPRANPSLLEGVRSVLSVPGVSKVK